MMGMYLVKEKDDFKVYFVASKQEYLVYKGDKLLVSGKFAYSKVSCYVE